MNPPTFSFQALTDAWRAWAEAELTKRPGIPKPADGVVHIRKRANRVGRPGYSRRHYTMLGVVDTRGQTLCGAEPTWFDLAWGQRQQVNTEFQRENGLKTCPVCCRIAWR